MLAVNSKWFPDYMGPFVTSGPSVANEETEGEEGKGRRRPGVRGSAAALPCPPALARHSGVDGTTSNRTPGGLTPAANMTSLPKKAGGLGAVGGTVPEGGAGWHQSWLHKGRNRGPFKSPGLWASTSPRTSTAPRRRPGGRTLSPTEGSRLQQREKQEGTSAPGGSSPTLQPPVSPGQAEGRLQRTKGPFAPADKTWASRVFGFQVCVT